MRAALALSLSLLLSPAAPARADEAPRKRVAVLEYRAGVVEAVGLAERLARQLEQASSLIVVDPAEARRRDGKIDAALAACGGTTECTAGLGRRLDVDEVLLVGISQLGDVVITLRRILVAEGTLGPQLAETVPAKENPADDRLLGWLKQLYPREAFRRFGFIEVTASLDGSEVIVNGAKRGETPLAGKLRVAAPRNHKVEVTHPGYVPFVAQIDVLPEATVAVRAELTPKDAPLPWYKRWYVWAIVGGLVAGGAIGVAVYVAQPDTSYVDGRIALP